MTDVNADKLVTAYLKVKKARTELKAKFDEEDAKLEAAQDKFSNALLEILKGLGADSLKTPNGTVSKSVRARYTTTDWDSMYKFVKEHDAFQLLQQRIHDGNMKAFLEENPAELPMGLNSLSKLTISVRRK